MLAFFGAPSLTALRYPRGVRAIAKTRSEPGLQIIDVQEPTVGPGQVKVQIKHGSVCGTDLHIFQWDSAMSGRIKPPRVIGHEFCGTIVEVGEGVAKERIGEFVSSESHIVCHRCPQCLAGDFHVCARTVLIGIDIDGGFTQYAVIPSENARLTPKGVPPEVASMLDALGNAVHTVMDAVPDGDLSGQRVLITGLGPIGLFAVAICRALGAETVVGTEIRPLRKKLGEELGATAVLDPTLGDLRPDLLRLAPDGFDITLEMSGHPSAIPLMMDHTRMGGRVSLLGLFHDDQQLVPMNKFVMHGLRVHGIIGRRLPQTWDQMTWLLQEKGLNVMPVVTDRMHYTEMEEAFARLHRGEAGKITLAFD